MGEVISSASDDGISELIVSSTPIFHGRIFNVDDVEVRLPDGKAAHRDVVRHRGAVGIIALTEDNQMVLVHQYRTSLEAVTLEIPAGKLEVGEDPEVCARRELEEETGYVAEKWGYLCPFAPAVGYSDEILHLFLATDLRFVGATPDADEFIHVDLVPVGEMVDRVLDGKIVDSKTMAAVLLCDAIARRMVD